MTKLQLSPRQAARIAIERSNYTLSNRLGGDSRRPSAHCDRPRPLTHLLTVRSGPYRISP